MTGRGKQILKKRAQRRELYLDENIRAFLMVDGSKSIGGEVISLSETGLAFICEPRAEADLIIGRVLELKLYFDARRFFTTTVQIRNKSLFQSQGSQYLRVGVSAHVSEASEEEQDIRQKMATAIQLGPDICGFVEIENPIFFDEVEYFRIAAVQSDCILISPLDNRHFLLPGQPVVASFSIPGSRVPGRDDRQS